jgi:uncharacterized protein (DUF1501 family)
MTFSSHSMVNRRGFLARGLAGTLGLAFSPAVLASLAGAGGPGPRAKRCVVVWLNGGPSHVDTFDPKPGTPGGGPFQAIDTAVPGLRLSEHLPRLAKQARHLAVVRSLTSPEADHDRAYQLLHTGNVPQETVAYPALGSVMARRWTLDESPLPTYVAINGEAAGPGFFGLDFAPYSIGDPSAPFANVKPPEGVSERRQARRLKALDGFDAAANQRPGLAAISDHGRLAARARRLMASPSLQALDLSKESPETRASFAAEGEDAGFGRGCLLALRLIEQGVRFVEVALDGWDTHDDNFNTTTNLMARLDPGLSALIEGLSSRGLLDETLVVCMGEFGRSPTITGNNGRDHWSEAFSAVLAGGGVRGGQMIGASDEAGAKVKDRPVTIPDFFATLLSAFGVDPAQSYTTPEGRPIKLADKGKVVAELFG